MESISSRELIERLRASLPLALELADPISGEPFTVNRDNMLALLVVDVDNLVLESQTVAMLYGEMARVHAAARLAQTQADVEFRQWKARKSGEARSLLDNGTDGKGQRKPPTGDQVEEYYRSDNAYADEYAKTNRASVIVDLIGDLKEAFKLKQRALQDLHNITFGHDRVQSADDRLSEMASQAEAEAIAQMAHSANELEEIKQRRLPPPAAQAQAASPAEKTAPVADAKSTKQPRKPKGAK